MIAPSLKFDIFFSSFLKLSMTYRGPTPLATKYYEDQAKFMYYLAFLNGKLQRIVGTTCNPDDAGCFDLR